MKRIFFLFLFFTYFLFSSSPHLVDAQCYQEGSEIKMELSTGAGDLQKVFGWGKKIIVFDQGSQTWRWDNESLSLAKVVEILERVNTQDEVKGDPRAIKNSLDMFDYIVQIVKYRDPVRFTTLYDNVLACDGEKTNLLSLLISS